MSNCPTCNEFVPDCIYGCYCKTLRRPINFDENTGRWYYNALGFRVINGFQTIIIRNCKPYTMENRQYIREKVSIENCDNWRSVCVEAYTSQNLTV